MAAEGEGAICSSRGQRQYLNAYILVVYIFPIQYLQSLYVFMFSWFLAFTLSFTFNAKLVIVARNNCNETMATDPTSAIMDISA